MPSVSEVHSSYISHPVIRPLSRTILKDLTQVSPYLTIDGDLIRCVCTTQPTNRLHTLCDFFGTVSYSEGFLLSSPQDLFIRDTLEYFRTFCTPTPPHVTARLVAHLDLYIDICLQLGHRNDLVHHRV